MRILFVLLVLSSVSYGQFSGIKCEDLNGKLVLSSNSKQINVSELKNGIYIVTINTNKGTARKRLVIQ